jgi:hypothetical protein
MYRTIPLDMAPGKSGRHVYLYLKVEEHDNAAISPGEVFGSTGVPVDKKVRVMGGLR